MKRSSSISAVLLGLALVAACKQGSKVNNGTSDGDAPRRTEQGERHEAPSHAAPDQEQLDSLKQEKLKDKIRD